MSDAGLVVAQPTAPSPLSDKPMRLAASLPVKEKAADVFSILVSNIRCT
jgi:hypothetical protein